MTEEQIVLEINGKLFDVIKLHGDGQCSCYGCEQKNGWNRTWTDFCYKYKNRIYCFNCLKELLIKEGSNMNDKAMLYLFVGEKGAEGKSILARHIDNSLRVIDNYIFDINAERKDLFEQLDRQQKDTIVIMNTYRPFSLNFEFKEFLEVLKEKFGKAYNITVCDFRREE